MPPINIFSKKPVLPERPEPPSYEQIHDDIRAAPDDDIVFKYQHSRINTKKSSGSSRKLTPLTPVKNLSSVSFKEGGEGKNSVGTLEDFNPNTLYENVEKFVDRNQKMGPLLETVTEDIRGLIEAASALEQKSTSLKAQANQALE